MKFILILLFVTTLFADNHEHHKEHHFNKELSHLDLSKVQQEKIKSVLKEFRAELKEYKKVQEGIEDKRKKLFVEDSFDAQMLNIYTAKLDAKAHLIENNFLKKVHAILTQEQRKKFINYFDDWEVK